MKFRAHNNEENKKQAVANNMVMQHKSTATPQLNSYQDMANKSPQVKQLQIYQAMVNQATQRKERLPGSNQTNTLQRYAHTHDSRVSDNGVMEVKNSGELWATEAGVLEANTRSPLKFTGAGTKTERASVTVTAGKTTETTEGGPDMKEWKRQALLEVAENVKDYADKEIESVREDEDKMSFIKKKIGIEDEQEFEEELVRRWNLWRAELLNTAIQRIEEYANDPRHNDPTRLNLKTDCGVMANVVTGKELDLYAKTPDIFHYIRQGIGDETIVEWEHHVAATIMSDDTDYVTLETAAAKVTDFFSKPDKDKAWEFKMYGAEKGQSFKDQYGPLMSGGREFNGKKFVEQED